MNLLVKRLNNAEDELGIHSPKKFGDQGFDLVVSEDTVVPPLGSGSVIVPSDVKIGIPEGYWCQIVGRSSTAKRGLSVQTATIDQGYTGKMFACCFNMTSNEISIKKGERLAQVVFFKSEIPSIVEVDELPSTERGETGFGSTNL